jgi:Domain of unknown function (DUF4956)
VHDILPFLEPGAAIKLNSLLQFLAVGSLCAGAIGLVYRRVSPPKPDEVEFAATLFILTIAIGLLVSIIKQAPAISFGLFGAMSIVRFRTQIKKPRRMVFLFMATAIGVCCGAGEHLVTLFGTLMLSVVALVMYRQERGKDSNEGDVPVGAVASAKAVGTPASGGRWSVDFVPTKTAGGARTRVLAIVDEESREALTLADCNEFSGARLVEELQVLVSKRGTPSSIVSDTWPECHAPVVLDWRKTSGIDWRYVSLNASAESAPFVASFSGLLQRECLDAPVTKSQPLQERLTQWQTTYNQRLEQNATRDARPPSVVLADTSLSKPMAPAGNNMQVYTGGRKQRRR